MAIVKVVVFSLTESDLALQEEITLTGMISTKIAKGEYAEDPSFANLQQNYNSAIELNGKLLKKLRSVRELLNSEEVTGLVSINEIEDLSEDE